MKTETMPGPAPSTSDTHDAILLARLQGDIDDLGLVTEAVMSLQDTDKHYCQHLETLGLGDDLSHLKWRHFTIMSVLAGECVRLQNRIHCDLSDMVKESPRLSRAKAHLEVTCSTSKNI